MAVTVAFDGTRVTDASSTTGWTGFGATPTVEPDFVYQGTASISCKVKTSAAGIYYATTAVSFASPQRIWIAKAIATTKDGLDGNGFSLRIGADISNYWRYDIFTATTYPVAGGWVIIAIDPNIAYTRTVGAGSPAASSIGLWGVECDFSATAKSENVAMDAIDYLTNGTGLTLTTSAASIGTFADFLAFDEGNTSNRYGIVSSKAGILYVVGVLTIGTSGTEGDFNDSGVVVVFPAHLVDTGFCGVDFNVQNASTVIVVAGSVFRGRGAQATNDTRPDFTVVGTSGTVTLTGCLFDVFRQIDLTTAATVASSFLNGRRVNAAGADLTGSRFEGCTGAADESYLGWNVATDPDGFLDDTVFVKGSTATHAIEFGTSAPTTMTLRGIDFSGYNASNGQNDSTLNFTDGSGKNYTVNLVGCSGNISYKVAGTSTVTLATSVGVSVEVVDESDAPIENAQTAVYVGTTAVLNQDTNASGFATGSYSGTTPAAAIYKVRKSSTGSTRYIPVSGPATIAAGTGMSVKVVLRVDPNA